MDGVGANSPLRSVATSSEIIAIGEVHAVGLKAIRMPLFKARGQVEKGQNCHARRKAQRGETLQRCASRPVAALKSISAIKRPSSP